MFFFFLEPWVVAALLAQFPHLDRATAFVDAVCAVDSKMSVGSLAAFLHVAERIPALASQEVSMRDIALEMGVPPTTFFRQLDQLAEGTSKIQGLNLLEKGIHPLDKRQRQVRLTPDGVKLLATLSALMSANREEPPNAGAAIAAAENQNVAAEAQDSQDSQDSEDSEDSGNPQT